jgi:Ohr subfamily peroxiredoxin
MSQVIYTATVEVTGGRGGTARSTSGQLVAELSRPSERGTDAGTDPEELFAAGYAACFDTALGGAARRRSARVGPTATTASVSLHSTPTQEYSISVALTVSAPDCEQQLLEELVELAHDLCPYSKATRGNIPLSVTVVGRGQGATGEVMSR